MDNALQETKKMKTKKRMKTKQTKQTKKTRKTRKNPFFEGIMEGLNDAVAIAEGRADPATYKLHVPETVDVRAIRQRMKMTQGEFAAAFGFSVARVRDWEQKRYAPDGALRAYLMVIERKPEAVREALAA